MIYHLVIIFHAQAELILKIKTRIKRYIYFYIFL